MKLLQQIILIIKKKIKSMIVQSTVV